MTVIQTITAPGDGPPLHVHANDDEFVCVPEGRLRVKFAETIHEAPAGSFVGLVQRTGPAVGSPDGRAPHDGSGLTNLACTAIVSTWQW